MEPIFNIQLGGRVFTQGFIERAKEDYMRAQNWTPAMRDDALAEAEFSARGWLDDPKNFNRMLPALANFELRLLWTEQINMHNAILQEYRAAAQRLTRYVLSEGRAEVTEERETGKFNPDGTPHTETFVVAPAIDPLPETVDVIEVGEDGEERTVVRPNPSIAQDEAERAAAQQVVDNAAQAVADIPCIYQLPDGNPDRDRLTRFFADAIA